MNSFDDPGGIFVVLVDDEGGHSLWPAQLANQDGWRG